MLKVYLDTNIYSDISNEIDDSFSKRIKHLAEKEILFLYSQAHLNDLSTDKTDFKSKELKIIDEIADTNFLQQDLETNRISNPVVKASEAFELFGEIQNDVALTLSSAFEETGESLVDIFLNQIKQQPVDLGPNIEEILSRDGKDQEKLTYERLGIYKRHYKMDEWSRIVTKILHDLESDPILLRIIRQQSKQYLEVDKFNIKIDDVKFNDKLARSKIGKSFKELLAHQMNLCPENQSNFFFEFITGYYMINFLGLDKEKNRKVRFKNTQNDGQHSYFGASSDILVSQDEGLLNKSKFLYSFYGFDTKVMSLKEFKTFINSYESRNFTNESLFITDLQLKKDRSLIVSERRPIIRHNQNEEIRILSEKYWGLFNRLSVVRLNEEDDEYVVLFASNYRSGNITYYKEVNYIIKALNKMHRTNYQHLSVDDIAQIKEGCWQGLTWETEYTFYRLRFNCDTNRFGLQVGPLNKIRIK